MTGIAQDYLWNKKHIPVDINIKNKLKKSNILVN